MNKSENFFQQSSLYAKDKGIREVLLQRIQKEEKKLSFGKTYIDKYELAKNRVSFVRSRAIENADRLILDFESLWIKLGGKCLWTVDNGHFAEEIKNLIGQHGFSSLGYSDSALLQETSIVSTLRNEGFSLHRIEQEVELNCDVTIQMADWAVVDSGLLSVNEWNQGGLRERVNAKMNIFLLPINHFVQQLTDIELLTSFQAIHTRGIAGFPFQSFISPAAENWVVFIDNNRTELMEDARLRPSLKCINCQACFEVCPVGQTIGDQAWQSPYKGPIGAIFNPKYFENEYYLDQTLATTSCGKCQDVCPVNIPLTEILNYSKQKFVLERPSKTEKLVYFFWRSGMEKRSKLEKGGSKLKNFMLRQFFRKSWGDQRNLPEVSAKSFNQLWKERKGI
jgi:L-lactate utilization protein LutB